MEEKNLIFVKQEEHGRTSIFVRILARHFYYYRLRHQTFLKLTISFITKKLWTSTL